MYQNKISYNLVKVDPGIVMCERNHQPFKAQYGTRDGA